jgi:hypothetical protein
VTLAQVKPHVVGEAGVIVEFGCQVSSTHYDDLGAEQFSAT